MRAMSTTLTLFAVLIVCCAFTLGLTWASCYAQVCPERYHPLATRMHIVAYYALLASILFALLFRASNLTARHLSQRKLTTRELPLFRKRITVGGLTLACWITGVVFATTAFWAQPLIDYWTAKCAPIDWLSEVPKLVVTGVFAHHADIALGLLLLPIGRNSLLGRAFLLHQHTLLYAHKLLAYFMVLMAFVHGASHYSFVAAWVALPWSQARKKLALDLENPNIALTDLNHLNIYFAISLFTGTLTFALTLVIVLSSLPALRRRSYNTFYYMHLIFSSLVFIGAGIHASTNFYFLLPGVLLWVVDWYWRLFRGTTGLAHSAEGIVEDAGHGWVRITLPTGNKRLPKVSPGQLDGDTLNERDISTHPLQTYWINIPSISRLQNHAFNVAAVGSASLGPTILCRPIAVEGKTERKQARVMKKQWTWQVRNRAHNTDNGEDAGARALRMRVEGPYLCADRDFESAHRIICMVAGTGVTGALSLADWYLAHRMQDSKASFTIIWTIRNASMAMLSEWQTLLAKSRETDGRLHLRAHVSSEHGRLDVAKAIREELSAGGQGDGKAWLYLSGPVGLLKAAEDACCDVQSELRKARTRKTDPPIAMSALTYYAAKWDV